MSVSEILIERIKQLTLSVQERVLKYVETMPADQMTVFDRFAGFVNSMDQIPSQLPDDLSKNHDHYLHGMPKRS